MGTEGTKANPEEGKGGRQNANGANTHTSRYLTKNGASDYSLAPEWIGITRP